MTERRLARRGLFVAAAAVLIAAGLLFWFLAQARQPEQLPPRPATEQPQLMLVTSLPLIFGESFGLDSGGSPALDALESRYQVRPINVADRDSLGGGTLLLMAHPRAQPAEALVELDSWVRAGGRVLILADPMLEWPSERPLGDRLRPPPAFADTGLLAHWGLRLDAPEERGPKQRILGGRQVLTSSPGALFGDCAVSEDLFVAHCNVGKGAVTIVADSDFLNLGDLDGPTDGNLDGLLVELDRLERR